MNGKGWRAVFQCIGLLLLLSCNDKKPVFDTLAVLRVSAPAGTNLVFEQSITNAQRCVQELVLGYRTEIKAHVPDRFHDRFLFLHGSIDSKLIVSETETFLDVGLGTSNVLSVEWSTLPVQLALLGPPTQSREAARLRAQPQKALSAYNEASAHFRLTNSWVIIENLGIVGVSPRMFSLVETSTVVLHDAWLTVSNVAWQRDKKVATVAFLMGEPVFDIPLDRAAETGRIIAQREIMDLFFTSKFFRAALAHRVLGPMAKAIVDRRQVPVAGNPYPFWEFQMDKEKLLVKGRDFGLEDQYTEALLSDLEANKGGASLFWPYSSLRGFIVQWSLCNLVLTLISVGLTFWKHSKSWYKISGAFLYVLLGGVNVWIFSVKPDAATILNWLIPGALFLTAFIPLWFRRDRYGEAQGFSD